MDVDAADVDAAINKLRALGLQPARIVIEPFESSARDRTDFSCGETALDDYIKTRVSQDLRRGVTRCSVLVSEPGHSLAMGYYTLNAHTIALNEMQPALAKKMRAYPILPAILLGRLAVDNRFKGTGLGRLLLMHALRTCLETSFHIGAMNVVVDALHDRAATFYQGMGFEPIGVDPLRLHLPMATVAALFPRRSVTLRALHHTASDPFAVAYDTE